MREGSQLDQNCFALTMKGQFLTDGGDGHTSLLRPRESVFSFKLEDSLKPLELECLVNPSAIAASASVVPMYVAESMASRVLLLVERPNGVY